jgi:hypothetical protein
MAILVNKYFAVYDEYFPGMQVNRESLAWRERRGWLRMAGC